MNIKKVLTADCIISDLKSSTKQGIIEEIIGFLADAGKLPDKDAALQAVLSREEKMSTGMQYGIAIPHGKTDSISHLVAAAGIHRTGIDFEAMDGQPSRIFILTISPASRTGPHIQFLAEVSKVLSDPVLREKILSAETAEEIVRLLAG